MRTLKATLLFQILVGLYWMFPIAMDGVRGWGGLYLLIIVFVPLLVGVPIAIWSFFKRPETRRLAVVVFFAPLAIFLAHEPQPGLMDKRGGLEGLPRTFLGQAAGGEVSQFGVDQRQQVLRRAGFSLFDGRQDACNIATKCRRRPVVRIVSCPIFH